MFLVEGKKVVVIDSTLFTSLAFSGLGTVIVRVCFKTVTYCPVQGKECLSIVCEVAGVIQRGSVAGGTEALGPQASVSHDVLKRLFNNLNLVLAGQEVLAIDALALAVFEGIVVGPDIDEIMNTVSAHKDGLGILGGTLGESRATLAELLEHNFALILGRHGGEFQGQRGRKC